MNLSYTNLFTQLATFTKKHALLCFITSVLYVLYIIGWGHIIAAFINSHHSLVALMSDNPSSSYEVTSLAATVIAITTVFFLVMDILSIGMCQYILAAMRDPKKGPMTTTTTFFTHGTWLYRLPFTALQIVYTCLSSYVVMKLLFGIVLNTVRTYLPDTNGLYLQVGFLFGTVFSLMVFEQYVCAICHYSNYLIIDGNQSFTSTFSKAHTLIKRVGLFKTYIFNNLAGIVFILLQALFAMTASLFYQKSTVTTALIQLLDDMSLIWAFIGLLIITAVARIKVIVGFCTPLHLLCNAVLYENLQETEAKTQ